MSGLGIRMLKLADALALGAILTVVLTILLVNALWSSARERIGVRYEESKD